MLNVQLNWAYRKFHHVFGSFTYLGKPVHGFKSTAAGVPLDTFGRNLYLDTYDSAYGKGWLRENSFLMHKGTGKFCYGFYSHGSRPEGHGTQYRATIIGPGVLPDIYWEAGAARRVRQGVRPAAARRAKGVSGRRPALQGGLAGFLRSAPWSGERLREAMRRYPAGVAVATVEGSKAPASA